MFRWIALAATSAFLGMLDPTPIAAAGGDTAQHVVHPEGLPNSETRGNDRLNVSVLNQQPRLSFPFSARGAKLAQSQGAPSPSGRERDPSLPQTQLGDPDPARVPTSEDQQRRRDELFSFIVGEYLGHGRESHRDRPELFAPRVRYYGRGTLSREKVLADKAAYYQRWPQRRYEFINDSMQSKPGPDDTISFSFRYNFEVSDGRETRRGVGIARLGIALIDDAFAIVSEDGRVIERR